MRTSYYLAVAAVLAAAGVAVFAQLPPAPPPLPPAPIVPPPPGLPPAPALPPLTTPPPKGVLIAPAPPGNPLPSPTPLPAVAGNGAVPGNPKAAELPPAGKVAVLADGKLVEGAVTVADDKVVVKQGALDRPFPKNQVLFVGETKDDVYRFLLGGVEATDAAGRLRLAKWCMFRGMREQALAEAREVAKLQPGNTAATDMVRSLEESLRRFPGDGSSPVPIPPANTPPAPGLPAVPPPDMTPPVVADPEPEVAAEAATAFATRIQPVVANLCAECHAKPDHPGAFKLARTVAGYDPGPQVTRQNLRAAAGQLRKDDPANSPLLAKALAAHGGQKQPAVVGRHAPAFQLLEAWAFLAVGKPGAPVAPAPAPPPADTGLPKLPAVPPPDLGPTPPVPNPRPALPPTPAPNPPALPPVPSPVKPPVPSLPPPGLPAVPPPPGIGTKFGQDAPAVVPAAATEPADEFDPMIFNRAVHPGRVK